jgi:hypothetical protein
VNPKDHIDPADHIDHVNLAYLVKCDVSGIFSSISCIFYRSCRSSVASPMISFAVQVRFEGSFIRSSLLSP